MVATNPIMDWLGLTLAFPSIRVANQSDHGLVRVWSVSAVKKQSCVLMVGDALQVVTSVPAGAVVPFLLKAPQLSSFVYHSPGDKPRP